jgi:hypothetical protein
VASAQAPIRSGSFELGGFVGSTYNVSQGAPMGGGNLSYAVTKMFLPYVEYSYFPSIQRNVSGNVLDNSDPKNPLSYPLTANYGAHASDFHVGVHLRFPIREKPLAPYAVLGIGGLTVGPGVINGYKETIGSKVVTQGCVDSNTGCTPSGIQVAGGTSAAVNFGGGLRYYATPKFGFRIEVKGYKPFGTSQPSVASFTTVKVTNTFLKAEVGFFFQFR